jgi:hypothetical protein
MIRLSLVRIARWSFRWRVVLPVVTVPFAVYLALLCPWLTAWVQPPKGGGGTARGSR